MSTIISGQFYFSFSICSTHMSIFLSICDRFIIIHIKVLHFVMKPTWAKMLLRMLKIAPNPSAFIPALCTSLFCFVEVKKCSGSWATSMGLQIEFFFSSSFGNFSSTPAVIFKLVPIESEAWKNIKSAVRITCWWKHDELQIYFVTVKNFFVLRKLCAVSGTVNHYCIFWHSHLFPTVKLDSLSVYGGYSPLSDNILHIFQFLNLSMCHCCKSKPCRQNVLIQSH